MDHRAQATAIDVVTESGNPVRDSQRPVPLSRANARVCPRESLHTLFLQNKEELEIRTTAPAGRRRWHDGPANGTVHD
jgi:hypothetical protein